MTLSSTERMEMVRDQRTLIPQMYGRVDFSVDPERFAVGLGDETELGAGLAHRRSELLANADQVARVRAYTMMGDAVADAYAALTPQHGAKALITWLTQACDHGLDGLPGAPPELARFIREMETLPSWLDPKLIEEGARIERNAYANRSPFATRGAIVGTFMNKYAALPMVQTGTLSHNSSARRIKETATFYTSMVMPDALDRHGLAFHSAAMVRLMHSMVRFNLLKAGDRWDVKTYGIPIPQIDQLPAGLVVAGAIAEHALAGGRDTFTPTERARVELARYRCFLLGLPEELLATTPSGIRSLLQTRRATLRKGFDENCVALVRATMDADLTADHSLHERVFAWMERGFARVVLVPELLSADKRAASGLRASPSHYAGAAAATITIAMRMWAYRAAASIPPFRAAADRSLVRSLRKQLARYGHAEFSTNAEAYRPAHA